VTDMDVPAEGEMIGGKYTVRGAARQLSVSEETIRRYIREGRLQASKQRTVGVRKVWLIESRALKAFAEA
jgi:excisionase family DNA binding protein